LIDGNQSISGVKTFTQGTTSTSTSTGTIVVSGNGGIGVGGNVHVGGTVNVTGSINVSNTVLAANLDLGFVVNHEAVTLATIASSTIASFPIGSFAGAKVVIQASRGTARQCSEILVTHDSTSATFTEYAIIDTGTSLYTANVDVSGSNVRILVEGTESTATDYKVIKHLFKI
jgi:hypothetical protein